MSSTPAQTARIAPFGEPRIAATLGHWRAFQHQHRGAGRARLQRGAQTGKARANHDDVGGLLGHGVRIWRAGWRVKGAIFRRLGRFSLRIGLSGLWAGIEMPPTAKMVTKASCRWATTESPILSSLTHDCSLQ